MPRMGCRALARLKTDKAVITATVTGDPLIFHGWTGFVMSNGCQGGPLCGGRWAWWLNDTTVWVEEREEILLFLWAGAGLMSPESPSWGEGGIFRTNSKYLTTPACHLRECPGHADQSPDTDQTPSVRPSTKR